MITFWIFNAIQTGFEAQTDITEHFDRSNVYFPVREHWKWDEPSFRSFLFWLFSPSPVFQNAECLTLKYFRISYFNDSGSEFRFLQVCAGLSFFSFVYFLIQGTCALKWIENHIYPFFSYHNFYLFIYLFWRNVIFFSFVFLFFLGQNNQPTDVRSYVNW